VGVGEHRIVAIFHPGGTCVVGLAGEVEPVAPVGPDLAGHTDGRLACHKVAALLDVELNKAFDV
jgi:hypothetical protein